ncbi:pyridoxal-phosphate dependent enzyme [Nonomuraea sp. H19]|uniref:PLP-dependent cysteine synthase family protein n=1 Tax=Nonomuraea sp. H19 TaxID=3452206 RepID=UPI003F8A2ED2
MSWTARALDVLAAGPPTPLIDLPVPAPGIRLLLKDESAQPTGSLRHRHARALFRQAIRDGLITEGTTVVEATGGNAAVAQAWFAQRLGLPYIVVMPGKRSEARARPVEALGGECRFVTPPLAIYEAARETARQVGGHFLDQFGRAAHHDLAEELFAQVRPDWVVTGAGTGATSATLGQWLRSHSTPTGPAPSTADNPAPSTADNPAPSTADNPAPSAADYPAPSAADYPAPSAADYPAPSAADYPAPSAADYPAPSAADYPAPSAADNPAPGPVSAPVADGGVPRAPDVVVTSADGRAAVDGAGRCRVAVADPENSAYFPGWTLDAPDYSTGMPSRIEGIGRPRMEPGFRADLVDLVIPVPDTASAAAARRIREVTGLPVGGASGTALWAALELVERMHARGETGTVVSVLGDAADRHLATCHDDEWAAEKGLDVRKYTDELRRRTHIH